MVCSIGNSCNQKIESNPSPMGRLKRRYGEWEKVTSSPFILGVIKDGYKLPFKVIPQPVELKITKQQGTIHILYMKKCKNYCQTDAYKR